MNINKSNANFLLENIIALLLITVFTVSSISWQLKQEYFLKNWWHIFLQIQIKDNLWQVNAACQFESCDSHFWLIWDDYYQHSLKGG